MAAALQEGAVGHCTGAVAAEGWREGVGVQCYYPAVVPVTSCISMHRTAIDFGPVRSVTVACLMVMQVKHGLWTTFSVHSSALHF